MCVADQGAKVLTVAEDEGCYVWADDDFGMVSEG
jgi:hypothetical protein